jgi:cell pole-organizing protein PopZ
MAKLGQAHDQAMEDILASIRRMISEDEASAVDRSVGRADAHQTASNVSRLFAEAEARALDPEIEDLVAVAIESADPAEPEESVLEAEAREELVSARAVEVDIPTGQAEDRSGCGLGGDPFDDRAFSDLVEAVVRPAPVPPASGAPLARDELRQRFVPELPRGPQGAAPQKPRPTAAEAAERIAAEMSRRAAGPTEWPERATPLRPRAEPPAMPEAERREDDAGQPPPSSLVGTADSADRSAAAAMSQLVDIAKFVATAGTPPQAGTGAGAPISPPSEPIGRMDIAGFPRASLADGAMAPLLSPRADAAVAVAFDELTRTMLSGGTRTIDGIVEDLLRPMLKGWLNANLPPLVERLVREEIERVSRGRP